MSQEKSATRELNLFQRIAGVFSSPGEAFEDILRKPSWLIPFLIAVVFIIFMQLMVADIHMKDQIARMRAMDVPAAQIEAVQHQMSGPMRYIGLIIGPVMALIIWVIISAVVLFAGNTILGGNGKFKSVFAVVAWSSLVGNPGILVQTILVKINGTAHGVSTSLAALLPAPALGEPLPLLFRVLSQFDIFFIWQLFLWVIGFSIVFSFSNKKSAGLVISVWVVWIVISVVVGGLFSGMGA